MDSTAYRIPIVLSEDGLSHIPLATGQQLAPWSVPVGTEGDYINPADLISKEPNNPLVLDAAGKLKVDMSRIINPSDTVLFIQNNLVSTQLGMELDNSQLILTGVNNTPIASVSLPIVPGLPIVAEFLHDFTPAPSDNVSGGYETGTYLHLRFAMSNGETKDIYVNYNSLDVEDYKVSYGLTLDNHIIGLKLAPDSGLSVTSQGLSVSGAYSAGNGVAISPQRAISVRAGTGLTFNSGELQALPYTAGNGVNITNRVVAIRLAGNGGLMLADGELAVKLSPNGYLVKTDSGLGVSDALLDMIDSAGDDAMARANEAYDLADGLSAQITGAYEVAEDAANSAALAQTQAATAIDVANNKVDRSGDIMTGGLTSPEFLTFSSSGNCKTKLANGTLSIWDERYDENYKDNLLAIHNAYNGIEWLDANKYPIIGIHFSQNAILDCTCFTHSVYGLSKSVRPFYISFPNSSMDGAVIFRTPQEGLPADDDSFATANTKWVNQRIKNAILDIDLSEIEAELENKADKSAVTALSNTIANKADKTTVQTLSNNLDNKVDRSGDTMTGYLKFSNDGVFGKGIDYEPINFDTYLFETVINIVRMNPRRSYGHLGVIATDADHIVGLGADYTNVFIDAIHLGVKSTQTGSVSTTVVTPISNSNDTSIANTEWVNQRLNTFGLTQAKENGQIGKAIFKGDVDFNTLTEDGYYAVKLASGMVKNQPIVDNDWGILAVYTNTSNQIYQILNCYNSGWMRSGNTSGIAAWMPINGNHTSDLTIYISKSGSDGNTGLESDYPVATFVRAFQIADKLVGGSESITVYFRVGAGDWGTLNIANKHYTVVIGTYDGLLPTEYSNLIPVFGHIHVYNSVLYVCGLCINGYLQSYSNSYVYIRKGYKRIWYLRSGSGGVIQFEPDTSATNILEMGSGIPPRLGFHTEFGGYIHVNQVNIKLTVSVTYSAFMTISAGSKIYIDYNSVHFLATSNVFTGKKYNISSGGEFLSGEDTVGVPVILQSLPGTQAGTDYAGSIYNGIPKGLLGVVAS